MTRPQPKPSAPKQLGLRPVVATVPPVRRGNAVTCHGCGKAFEPLDQTAVWMQTCPACRVKEASRRGQ